MNPTDFFEVSKRIKRGIELKRPSSFTGRVEEAWIRTGISRTYYSVFLFLRDKLSFQKYTRSNVHGKVINRLRIISPEIAHKLQALRIKRDDADYNLLIRFRYKDLIWAISIAEDIFTKSKNI